MSINQDDLHDALFALRTEIAELRAKNEDLEARITNSTTTISSSATNDGGHVITPDPPATIPEEETLSETELLTDHCDLDASAATALSLESCSKSESFRVEQLVRQKAKSRHERMSAVRSRLSASVIEHHIHLKSMNQDAYSFLYTADSFSPPSLIGMLTVALQFSMFSLFLMDILNTQEMPPNVDIYVRTTQAIAILVSFFAETDMRVALRAFILHEGVDVMQTRFASFSRTKFIVANTVMFLQGLLGEVVTMFLIFYADNVFDLLLNFTAILFVSQLDEFAFHIASLGYFGNRCERMATKVMRTEFPPKSIFEAGATYYLHIYILAGLMTVAFISYGVVIHKQTNHEGLTQLVQVEFGDEVDPTLGLYSGCYQMQSTRGWTVNARVKYTQTQPEQGQGQFQYCSQDNEQTWVFDETDSDTCIDHLLQSSENRPTSFDLLDTKGDQWVLQNGYPISFQLAKVEECGDPFDSNELCSSLTMNANLLGFSGSHDWSRNFEFLTNQEGKVVRFYQHPVFVGEFSETAGYEVIFFTGRRWVLAGEAMLLPNLYGNSSSIGNIINLFETAQFWLMEQPIGAFAFVSEAVGQANDRGTPLGLRWYESRYVDSTHFPFADITKPIDAMLKCSRCSKTNPCFFEGECNPDGSCTCKNGASGKLCDIKPLGDGVCNPFFNKDVDAYDSGDCCGATCTAKTCGNGDMRLAFGQNLAKTGNGFPHCVDPSMQPVTIVLNTTVGDLTLGSFESYTLEVKCMKEDQEMSLNLLRIALDPSVTGVSNQTIYVADQTSGCALSFLSIQSFSELEISFQVLDGVLDEHEASPLMKQVDGIGGDGVFPFPALYSRCLKDALANVMDPMQLYTGSYQDESVGWLDMEISDNGCDSNQYLVERFALVTTSFAEVAPETWIDRNDHCFWPRVTCNENRVVELTYDGETNGELDGVVPDEVGLLKNLERLVIFGTHLTGTLPKTLGSLTAVTTLALSGNRHSGILLPELGTMSALTYVSLKSNRLTGPIPSELGLLSAMTRVRLRENYLTGSLPSEFQSMTSLTSLELSRNHFTGSIPTVLASMTSLNRLWLGNNFLSGQMPSYIFTKLTSLTDLRLSNQFLTGQLPMEVRFLSNLEHFEVGNNSLTGSVPPGLFELTSLSRLKLARNGLTGSIDASIGNLTALSSLHLQQNAFTGSLPSFIGLLSNLFYLDLRDNNFHGNLPSEVGLLTDLEYLLVGGNQLEGRVPTEFSQLTKLQNLDLDRNVLNHDEVKALSSTLGLDYSCNQTTVEILITTEGGVSWELASMESVAATGELEWGKHVVHKESICVPVDACHFTFSKYVNDADSRVEISRLNGTVALGGISWGDWELSVNICELVEPNDIPATNGTYPS